MELIRNDIDLVIDLLSEMIVSYIAKQEKVARRSNILKFIERNIAAEENEWSDHCLTSELLGTEDYVRVA